MNFSMKSGVFSLLMETDDSLTWDLASLLVLSLEAALSRSYNCSIIFFSSRSRSLTSSVKNSDAIWSLRMMGTVE